MILIAFHATANACVVYPNRIHINNNTHSRSTKPSPPPFKTLRTVGTIVRRNSRTFSIGNTLRSISSSQPRGRCLTSCVAFISSFKPRAINHQKRRPYSQRCSTRRTRWSDPSYLGSPSSGSWPRCYWYATCSSRSQRDVQHICCRWWCPTGLHWVSSTANGQVSRDDDQ